MDCLVTESDVEQKFIIPLLTREEPFGLGYRNSEFLSKHNIRKLSIDKGSSNKLYYPDFIISLSGYSFCVIEAKKPGEDLKDAYREARLYANEINALYKHGINPCIAVLVTDGQYLLAGYADSDQPHIVMEHAEINPASQKFSDLVKLVGRESALNKSEELNKALKKGARFYSPKELLGGKAVSNQSIEQNTFGNNIAIEFKSLLNPKESDEKKIIVENAYVTTKRKEGHLMSIDKIIRAARSASQHSITHIEDSSNPIEFQNLIKKKNQLKGMVCLLVGSVGSGKSTFTRYLEFKGAGSELKNEICWHYLDLNNAPLNRDLIYNWVLDCLIDSIKLANGITKFNSEMISKIFSEDFSDWEALHGGWFEGNEQQKKIELYQLSKELQADRRVTLRRLMEFYYLSADVLPIIVFDNCDKGSREDQLLMFEVANWFKDSYPCLVFLPLRDITYDNFSNQPPLDTVIKDMVFRIDPPDLEKVLRLRVDYLQRDLLTEIRNFEYTTTNGVKIQCKKEEIGTYLKCVIESLFSDQFVKGIIKGIVGKNIRLGLEMVTDFCKSGHISEDELFKIRTSTSGYKMDLALVMDILMRSDKVYYSDETSVIKNLFNASSFDDLPDPLIRYSILLWLLEKRTVRGPNGVIGWHKIMDLKAQLQMSGHDINIINSSLEHLLKYNLIENETQDRDISEESLITITSVGITHLSLIKHYYYLSIIAEDCYFRENQIARKIADNMEGIGIYQRNSAAAKLDTSRLLLDYLIDYYESFINKGSVFAGNDGVSGIEELKLAASAIRIKSEQENIKYRIPHHEHPPGKIISATVSSIKDKAFFVEFSDGLVGSVYFKKYGEYTTQDISMLEIGDEVLVEIIEWRNDHKKFDLSLKEIKGR